MTSQRSSNFNQRGIRFTELRSAWGVRVCDLNDTQVHRIKQMLDDSGIAVSALGTDLGKIRLDDDFGAQLDRARRAADIAWYLETSDVRGFSFSWTVTTTRRPAAMR